MIEAGPVKQNVFSVRKTPPRFAPEGSSSGSRGKSQASSVPRTAPSPLFSPSRPKICYRRLLGRVPISKNVTSDTGSALNTKPRVSIVTL